MPLPEDGRKGPAPSCAGYGLDARFRPRQLPAENSFKHLVGHMNRMRGAAQVPDEQEQEHEQNGQDMNRQVRESMQRPQREKAERFGLLASWEAENEEDDKEDNE